MRCTYQWCPASRICHSHSRGHGNGIAMQCFLHHCAWIGYRKAERGHPRQQLRGQPRERCFACQCSRKGQRHLQITSGHLCRWPVEPCSLLAVASESVSICSAVTGKDMQINVQLCVLSSTCANRPSCIMCLRCWWAVS